MTDEKSTAKIHPDGGYWNEPIPDHVDGTGFEEWLDCREPACTSPRLYTEQDMRDAYWAGFLERARYVAPSLAAIDAGPSASAPSTADFIAKVAHSIWVIEPTQEQEPPTKPE